MKLEDIKKFERLNPKIAVNVFLAELRDTEEFEEELDPTKRDSYRILPRVHSSENNREHVIDLLYLTDNNGNSHYCLIKNFQGLVRGNGNKNYICRKCLNGYTSTQALFRHESDCGNQEPCNIEMPDEDNNDLFFDRDWFRTKMPCMIAFDFEATNTPYDDKAIIDEVKKYHDICYDIKLNPSKYTEAEKTEYTKYKVNSSYRRKMFHQQAYSYKWKIKTDYPGIFSPEEKLYRGKSSERTLKEWGKDILMLEEKMRECLEEDVGMNDLTEEQEEEWNESTHCSWCNSEYIEDDDDSDQPLNPKVHHHNHYNGEYVAAICHRCNIREGNILSSFLYLLITVHMILV
jgi:hypothetical protein